MNVDVHKFCVSVVSCLVTAFGLNKVVQTWNSHSIPGIHLFDQEKYMVYTFLTNEMETEIWKSNLNLKLKIRFKQKSKFVFYFLFFEKLKIDEKIRYLRVVYLMWLIRGCLDTENPIRWSKFSFYNWNGKGHFCVFQFRFKIENLKMINIFQFSVSDFYWKIENWKSIFDFLILEINCRITQVEKPWLAIF